MILVSKQNILQIHFEFLSFKISKAFTKAAADVNKLKEKPSDEDLLEIYGLYKQATVGDVNTSRPGMFDLKGFFCCCPNLFFKLEIHSTIVMLFYLKGKAKWDSWNDKKGKSKEDAEKAYIDKVNQLISKHGLNA